MTKLLIVEDDLLLDEAYRRRFGGEYELRIVANGEEGIREAIEWVPEAILLDIYLTGRYNGLEVLEKIRKESSLDKTVVIVITNMPDTNDRAMNLGADMCYMKTEVNLNLIDKVIRELSAKKQKHVK